MQARFLTGVLGLLAVALVVSPVEAQPVGTFRWQLQPYCNVVTVAVTQNGGVYRLEGTDDQCGTGGASASVIGTAFPNPSGSIGLGLNIVSAPGGAPGHVDATVTLPSASGTWRDSAGRSGPFVLTPGAGTGGSPRPTTASIGVIGATGINPAEVQLRISGSCAAGLFMQSIGQGGTVGCAAPPIAGNGVPPAFSLQADGGFLARGSQNVGTIPASGAGTRMMWFPAKAAFRAGSVGGAEWDDVNIGTGSTAMGFGATASAIFSTAIGRNARASRYASTAIGDETTASGEWSIAMGQRTTASGQLSTAMGFDTNASGERSTAMGNGTTASGFSSTALGGTTTASGEFSTAMGSGTRASGNRSTAMGYISVAGGSDAIALGARVNANGTGSVVLGSHATAATTGVFMYGDRSTTTDLTTAGSNEFLVRAAGGTIFFSNAAMTTGVVLNSGLNSWQSLGVSDENRKTDFRDLDGEQVLGKLAALPVREWRYTTQDAGIRHVGPTAQDFRAAFGLGESEERIGSVDADGIALAGVKALEARMRATNEGLARQNESLTRTVADLRARLARLEALLEQ